jgi:two-component system response regulator YesN
MLAERGEQTMKVILVDDETPVTSFLSKKILQMYPDYEIVGCAANGREAIELLETAEVDLLISDIKMPVMDGLELCKIANRRWPSVMIILISGYSEFDFAQQAMRSGVSGYLLKPIVNEQLKEMLESLSSKIQLRYEQNKQLQAAANYEGRTSSWLTGNYLKSVMLGRKPDINSCAGLFEKLSVKAPEGAFLAMRFSVSPYDEDAEAETALADVTGLIAEDLRGYSFIDTTSSSILLVPIEEPAEFCAIVRETRAKVMANLPPGVNGVKASAVFARDAAQLPESYYQMSCMAFSENASQLSCLMTEYCQPEYGCAIITQNAFQYLAEICKYAKIVHWAVLSGNFLTIPSLIEQLYALYARNVSFRSCGEILFQIGSVCLSCFERDGKRTTWYSALEQLAEKYGGQSFTTYQPPQGFVSEFVEMLRGLDNSSGSTPRTGSLIVENTKDIILSHYREPLSLSIIAEQIGVSANYLSNLFAKETGETYTKYLTRIRMNVAVHYIQTRRTMKISEIAEKTGFISSKHFLHTFKKYFGMTPSAYKALHE